MWYYKITSKILPLLFPKEHRCPHCGYKMEFVPKNSNQPWIMHNGYGCPHCGYYFITKCGEKNGQANVGNGIFPCMGRTETGKAKCTNCTKKLPRCVRFADGTANA